MELPVNPSQLVDLLRAWFFAKDRSVVLANNTFIEGNMINTPANPIAGRRRLYVKDDCWYDLDSDGAETSICVSGVDPTGHTHSKLVASDGVPDPSLSADGNGYLSTAVQPLFSAYNSATDNNVTGDGTNYTIICNTEIFDINSNYNNATGIFTAPITGKYLLVAAVTFQGVLGTHTRAFARFQTSNRYYQIAEINSSNVFTTGGFLTCPGSAIADMDASDTAKIDIRVSGGAKVVNIYGNPNAWTYFMGYLLI